MENIILPLSHRNSFVSSNVHSECFHIASGFSLIVRDFRPVFVTCILRASIHHSTILIADVDVAQQHRKPRSCTPAQSSTHAEMHSGLGYVCSPLDRPRPVPPSATSHPCPQLCGSDNINIIQAFTPRLQLSINTSGAFIVIKSHRYSC
jgi:hypothetical protein